MTTSVDAPQPRRANKEYTRLPTMQDIADHLGVSRPLVSMVMRGMPGPSAESRERILAVARELGYHPNTSAQLLRQQRTRLIGVLFSLRNPFQVRFVERFFERAADEGFNVALGPMTAGRPTDAVVAELMSERVEALVAFNPDPNSAALAAARDVVPVVWLGEWVTVPGIDNINVDEAEGLRLAIEHLVTLGHSDIAYVGEVAGRVWSDRADAYRSAMHSFGLSDRVDLIATDYDEEGGAAAARQIVKRATRPTAVLCCGDQCAAGVMAVFARSGVQVPRDISVVGFDDSYLASLSYHQLTSIRQNVDAMVDAALESVVGRIDGDEETRGPVATAATLVVRESTGPARNRATTS